MAGRWNDDEEWRERARERNASRYDVFGLNDEPDDARWEGREDRSFRSRDEYRDDEYEDRAWQDPDYGGVSPAMQRGDYEYRGRGRFGRPGRNRAFQAGSRGYGDRGRPYEGYIARRYGAEFSPQQEERYQHEMRRTASGGTGGYDYERGYGDGPPRREGYEDRARDAGAFFRRAGQRLSDWFAGDNDRDYRDDVRRYEAFRDSRGVGARGLGPKGYKRSDDRISDEAHERLTDDPWVDATHIEVAVASGEVTLSGTVENREAKHRAERLVEDMAGVTHVQNNLRVSSGSYFTSAGRGYGDAVQDAQMQQDTTGVGGVAARKGRADI